MMMNSVVPLKIPRLATLAFATVWAIVSFAVGINAFVKSNSEQNRIKSQVPLPTTLDIDISDVFTTGVIITVLSGVLAFLCVLCILSLLARRARTYMLPLLQAAALAFLALVMFAVQIPLSLFTATRSVRVTAYIDGFPLPASVVQVIERAMGVKTVYRDIDYLNLLAILPWLTIFSAASAAFVSLLAARRSAAGARVKAAPISSASAARAPSANAKTASANAEHARAEDAPADEKALPPAEVKPLPPVGKP
ncbi:hypothetical protein B0H10DRAFT_2074003 [Mycena sp. CBHHK59/15]|nr:hypothetical protein B0H10DRAFT_2074003 [Mycena sp. CBHHK59/15]